MQYLGLRCSVSSCCGEFGESASCVTFRINNRVGKIIVSPGAELRAATLRVMRCFAHSSAFLNEVLTNLNLGYFIAR